MARRGLTLIELLVVVGMISLLLMLSVPVLMRAKNQAQSAVCVQNLKSLSLAWILYKDDNDDHLVGGDVGSSARRSCDWVMAPAETSIESEKEGIRRGALFRYVSGEVNIYRCPVDRRKSIPDQTAFRSYSIPGGANGEGWLNTYAQAVKYADISQPAGKYVFMEEADPRGWNKGSWVINPKSQTWVDPLAIWHSRVRSSLAYADGHAEIHRWLDQSTIQMSEKQQFFCPVPAGEGEDLRFMLSGFPQKTGESVQGGGAG
jgi:prepilin-type N-terminal cleavage/methylation domain-containing protein